MKRLLKSSKFWIAMFGSVVGIVAWRYTQDVTITSLIIGLFGAGSVGTSMEDAFGNRTVGNRPDDRG